MSRTARKPKKQKTTFNILGCELSKGDSHICGTCPFGAESAGICAPSCIDQSNYAKWVERIKPREAIFVQQGNIGQGHVLRIIDNLILE